MSLSGRLIITLLAGALLLPAGATVAQEDRVVGWTTSWDGLALGTNDAVDHLPTWRTLQPDEYPPAIAGIPEPSSLYRVGETIETGTRVAQIIDGTELTWLQDGHTPILATAIIDDEGATWARGQHIVSMPTGCPSDVSDCRIPDLFLALADLAAPATTPVSALSVGARLEPGMVAGTAVVERDGTLFTFGGDARVATKVIVRDDGRVVVRAAATVGEGFGGQLRGYDAYVLDAADPGLDRLRQEIGGLIQRARAVRDRGVDPEGLNVRRFDCPPSGQGYALGQYLFNGLGSAAGASVDPALEGGVTSLVTDIVFFDCRPPQGDDLLVAIPDEPVAAFVCGSTRASHRPFSWTRNGQQGTSNSSLAQRWAVATLGVAPGTPAFLEAAIGGANGDERFTVPLEGMPLRPSDHPDAVLWLGRSEVGIDSHGPKPYRSLQLNLDGSTFALADQQRAVLGDSFDVGPSEKPNGNCRGFDFTGSGTPILFGDAFESGDVFGWTTARPD